MNNQEIVINGFVLKNIEYKENDGIITCLTEQGLVTFKARGINKLTSKNRSSCLLYARSEFTLEEAKTGHLILTKGKLLNSNFNLYSSLDYMTCLGLVSESILTFLDVNISQSIYNLFSIMITNLDKFDVFTLTAIFLAKIIIESGYQLDTSHCVRCSQQKSIVAISYLEGGFICKKCLQASEKAQNSEYLKSIRYTFMVDEDNYLHYEFKKNISTRLIKEYLNYLQENFGYKKLFFFDLFNQTY